MRSRTAFLWLLLAAVWATSSCATSESSDRRESFAAGMRREASRTQQEPGATGASAPTASDARAPGQPGRPQAQAPRPAATGLADTRVMLYQPKGDLLLILVNEGHRSRQTEDGRLALALGESTRAYKVLSDAQMSALLQSLNAAGYDANSADFVPEDAQYLTPASADIPRYQGLISVESGTAKTRVLGFRKSSEGDALGLRRYQTYTRLKALVQKWFGDSSRSEFPVGGVTIPPTKGPS